MKLNKMRYRLGLLLLIVLAVAGLFQAVIQLRFETDLAAAEISYAKVVGDVPSYSGEDLANQAYSVLNFAQQLVSRNRDSLSSHLLEAKTRLLIHQLSAEKQLLCFGITNLKNLISSIPYSAEAYLLASEMVASSKDDRCEEGSFSFDRVVSAINNLAPVDTPLLYRAGYNAIRLNNPQEGLKLLSKSQALDPHFSVEQQNFLFELVASHRDLKSSLAPSYPVITKWVDYFYFQRRYNFDLWRESFIAAVHQAVTDLDYRFNSGVIDIEALSLALKEIAQLPTTYLDDNLRRRLDVILQRIYSIEGANRWASFIASRSQIKRIPILKSTVVDDRSARSQQLYGWMADDAATFAEFDKLGNAIGMYIPKSWHPHYILLQGEVGARVEKGLQLELWVSDDNQNYYKLPLEDKVQQITVDGIDRVIIPAKSIDNRFLKLRYLGSNQSPKLTGNLGSLVEVYGVSSGS